MFLFKTEVDTKALLVIHISTSVVTHHDRGWCLSTAVGLGTKDLEITPHAGEAVLTRLKARHSPSRLRTRSHTPHDIQSTH